MRFRWHVVAAGLVAALVSPMSAQDKKDDRFEKAFFDPQLVLQRAKEIGVTAQQRTAILEVIKKLNDQLQAVEGEADKVLNELLRDLYSKEQNAVKIVFARDLFDLLEKVADRARDAGNVINHIVLKNS